MRITLPWGRIFGKSNEALETSPAPAPQPRADRRSGPGSEMENVLDKVEADLLAGHSIPWTSLTVVDQRSILTAIDHLRTSLPLEVEAGRRIIADEQRILTAARIEAARITGEAEKKARLILEENHLRKMAEEEAAVIMQEAQAQGQSILEEAGEQAWRVYHSLEQAREILHSDLLRLRTETAGAKGYRRRG